MCSDLALSTKALLPLSKHDSRAGQRGSEFVLTATRLVTSSLSAGVLWGGEHPSSLAAGHSLRGATEAEAKPARPPL